MWYFQQGMSCLRADVTLVEKLSTRYLVATANSLLILELLWSLRSSCFVAAVVFIVFSGMRLCLPQRSKLELIFALRPLVSEIQAIFQSCHIWVWNVKIGNIVRCCTYILYLPQGVELSFHSLYGQRLPRYSLNSKLLYLGMKLGHWPKFQKLPIYSRSTPGVRNLIELIFAPRAAVSEIQADFQSCHIWT